MSTTNLGYLIVLMNTGKGAFPFPICLGAQYARTNPQYPAINPGVPGLYQVALGGAPTESLVWTSQALPGPTSPSGLTFLEWRVPVAGTPQAPAVPPAPGVYSVPLPAPVPGWLVVTYVSYGPGAFVLDIFSSINNPGLPPLPALPPNVTGSYQVQIRPQGSGGGGGGGTGGGEGGGHHRDDDQDGDRDRDLNLFRDLSLIALGVVAAAEGD